MSCIRTAKQDFDSRAEHGLVPTKGLSLTYVYTGHNPTPIVVGVSNSSIKSSDVESILGFKYQVYHTDDPGYVANVHSEVDAILQLIRKQKSKHTTWLKHNTNKYNESEALDESANLDASQYTFINVRFNDKGDFSKVKSSGPCNNCMHALNQVGFAHVYYHECINGEVVIMEVDKQKTANV